MSKFEYGTFTMKDFERILKEIFTAPTEPEKPTYVLYYGNQKH